MLPAPKVDVRTATDITRQVERLLAIYAPQSLDPATGQAIGAGAALVGIFARFAELIVERLNHLPEKNFLAFLDLLGASLLPPQAARAPLTFSLSAGSAVDAVVPAGTQVAASPGEADRPPVIFETEQELVVTAARLTSVFARDPGQDSYADLSAVIDSRPSLALPIFSGDRSIEHIFYIGHDTLFTNPGLKDLKVTLTLDKEITGPDAPVVRWELWNGAQWVNAVVSGSASRLARQREEVTFTNLSALVPQTVARVTTSWLRCRLLTPITPATEKQQGMVSVDQLPRINDVSLRANIGGDGLSVEAAFANTTPVDATKDFFPFGEKPAPGDTLYLAVEKAFSEAGSLITININLSSPGRADGNPKLKWEFWDGETWAALGTTGAQESDRSGLAADTSRAFTVNGAENQGAVETFILGDPTRRPARTVINGVESFWVRVRIISGNYGVEARYVLETTKVNVGGKDVDIQVSKVIPATFAPPVISSITVSYSLTKTARAEVILTYNDFIYEDVTNQSFDPFKPTIDARPTLYLGFTLPAERKGFPNRKLSLFSGIAEFKYGQAPVSRKEIKQSDEPLQLAWEYYGLASWSTLLVRDGSESFTKPGLIEFLAPPDFSRRSEFGLEGYWLRAVWKGGEYSSEPRINRLLLNTVMAVQAATIKDEIVGSSDASKGQRFRTTHAPVLEGQQLEVREPEMPSAREQERIRSEGGERAISVVSDQSGRPREIWVRWSQVPDFYGSEPRDRHYVMDHLTGEIRFGDGINGLIPPGGAGNIRMSLYRTGGGDSGNISTGILTQLKTTVPYVERVTNYEPATGGTSAETHDSLLRRAPRMIRHRGRAVTVEDYEDLALMASSEVARVCCVPLYDLAADPNGAPVKPGAVSIIVVPRSTDAKPVPGLELIRRVRDFISARRIPTSRLAITGPKYIRVSVNAEVAPVSLEGAGEIDLAIYQSLVRFLHPLTGGLSGAGWDFGREPHKSDLYTLIESIPGVDHVRALEVIRIDDTTGEKIETDASAGFGRGDRFLVYSGTHNITLRFERE